MLHATQLIGHAARLLYWFIDWFIDWSFGRSVCLSISLFVCLSVYWLIGSSIDRSVGRSVCLFVCLLIYWLVYWLIGRSVCLSVYWLIDWLIVFVCVLISRRRSYCGTSSQWWPWWDICTECMAAWHSAAGSSAIKCLSVDGQWWARLSRDSCMYVV